MRNQEQGAGMRSTPDTLLLYSKACITSAKIHFHIVNQANMAYNNLCVSQNISALCGSRITSHCPALLPIVQGGTPLVVPDILNNILSQSHTDNKQKICASAVRNKILVILTMKSRKEEPYCETKALKTLISIRFFLF